MTDPGVDDGDRDADADSHEPADSDSDADPDPDPLALGVRWLRTVPTTLAISLVLCAVYALEFLVVVTAGRETATWWFVATTTPSPGWLLGMLAHTPADPTHLLGNLALLIVFGGLTERRLGRRHYLVALAVAGLGGTAGQLFWYALASEPGGTLGASAMALAATAFGTVTIGRERLATGDWPGETAWVWALFGAAVLGRRLALDLVVGVPAVGRFGHLWGVLFGAMLAFARPVARPWDAED